MSAGRSHRRQARRWQQSEALADAAGQPARLVSTGGGSEIWTRGRVMFVVPGPPPDDAPAAIREGITRRRLVATAGACPCGATLDQPRHGRVSVRHETDCPAADDVLGPAIEAWSGR